MGQDKPGTSPMALLWPLRPERLLLIVLLVITVGFGIGYARLFYEHRQALAERDQAAARVRYEERRHRDLVILLRLSAQEWFRQAEAARLFGRSSQPAESEDETNVPAPASTEMPREGTKNTEEVPTWQQWLQVFHLAPPSANRPPE